VRSALIRASNSDGVFRSAKDEAADDLELSGDKGEFSVRKRANARAGSSLGLNVIILTARKEKENRSLYSSGAAAGQRGI
jgi:hypothetical protein